MPIRVRRSHYVFFYFGEGAFLDFSALFRGDAKVKQVKQVYALSILRGETFPIDWEDLVLLETIPETEWIDASIIEPGDGQRLGADF